MNYFLEFFVFALLVARMRAQICFEETLDCNEPVPTIFKLGEASSPCNKADHTS